MGHPTGCMVPWKNIWDIPCDNLWDVLLRISTGQRIEYPMVYVKHRMGCPTGWRAFYGLSDNLSHRLSHGTSRSL